MLWSVRGSRVVPPLCATTVLNPVPPTPVGDSRLRLPRRGKIVIRRVSCRWRGRFARLSRPSGLAVKSEERARRALLRKSLMAGWTTKPATKAQSGDGFPSFPCWLFLPLSSTRQARFGGSGYMYSLYFPVNLCARVDSGFSWEFLRQAASSPRIRTKISACVDPLGHERSSAAVMRLPVFVREKDRER